VWLVLKNEKKKKKKKKEREKNHGNFCGKATELVLSM
jgi:hypothetical protein